MEIPSGLYIVAYAVILISLIMGIIAIQGIRTRRFQGICILFICVAAVLLSLNSISEHMARYAVDQPFFAVFCTFFGYVVRPFILYAFILLARKKFTRFDIYAMMPIWLNVLVYALSLFIFFEPLRRFAFFYEPNDAGTMLVHHRGYLNYFSHILCLLYLVYLVSTSVAKLRGKHRTDALSILICASMIVAAVLFEMFGFMMGVLNLSIAISCIFYYLFLLKEENRRDSLTGLFDRKTYYADLDRFGKEVTALVSVDMNGLKTLNDQHGHEAGDKALRCIGNALDSHCNQYAYAYRIGGDEFVLIAVKLRKEDVQKLVEAMKSSIESEGYSCSFGLAYKDDASLSLEDLLRQADSAMYEDKASFYQRHPEFDRRNHSEE